MHYPRRALVAAAAAALAATFAARAADLDVDPPPADLSLEELLKVDVQTASRKSQRLQDVAAAAFVITRDDIERSGATSIPEVLRLAPGVQVARIGNNRWSVSARGFNGRFANKLLVLMDGRSIYSPLFSGVMWEAEDTMLEDIERIEVIRGPGASLWGANAVNGVINIITRKARDTRGTLVVAGAGSEDKALAEVRHGVALQDGDLRVWAKAFARDESVDAAGTPGNDDWRALRAGFRGDWALDASRHLTLSGSAYGGPVGDRWNLPSLTSPTGSTPVDVTENVRGAHLLARHEWLASDGTEVALQSYFDRSHLDIPGAIRQLRDTLDIDFQMRPQLGGMHDVVWGLGYRESRDDVTGSGILVVTPQRRSFRLFSGFLQDELTLRPDALRLVLGARLEHNSFTGFEPQPNARLIWTPTPQQSIWSAVSRAVRTPSRAEPDIQIDLSVTPANPPQPPVLLRNEPPPDHQLRDEVVNALELGLRQQFEPQLSLDLALFHNRYRRLRAGTLGASSFELLPVPHAVQSITPSNGVSATTDGLELALDWHPTRQWRVQPAYSTIRIRADAAGTDPIEASAASEYSGSAPRHQLSLRSSLTLADRSQFDLWLRHVSGLPSTDPRSAAIPAYTTLDLRWAWRLQPGLELSLVGQNLLQPSHAEIVPDYLPSQPLEVQRSIYAKVKWQF